MLRQLCRWWSDLRAPTAPRKPACRFVPRLESLEERTVPALLGVSPLSIGNGPRGVVVGDFNGDGVKDLFTTHEDGTFQCSLGQGNGSFVKSQSAGIGGTLVSLAAFDYNGDGKLDVVGVDLANDFVRLLAGSGDGKFSNG